MQISVEETWEAAQKHLRSKLSPDTYNLWFAPLRAHAQGDDSLVFEVPNDFCEVWLKDNYTGLLQDVVALAPPETRSSKPTLLQPSYGLKNNNSSEFGFNSKNKFDTFVVGDNNSFAHAAALAVAQSPGRSYNPLFVYGGVGLGKTHLL